MEPINKYHRCDYHNHHLFNSPCCKNLSFIRKVANITFHILTLGIPLILYHLVSYCSSREIPYVSSHSSEISLKKEGDIKTGDVVVSFDKTKPSSVTVRVNPVIKNREAIPSSPQTNIYTEEALNFVQNILTEYKSKLAKDGITHNANDWTWNSSVEDVPCNKDIPLLVDLFWKKYFCEFKDCLRRHHASNTWNNDEVLKVTDDFMKISYVISLWTIEDLPNNAVNMAHDYDEEFFSYDELLDSESHYSHYAGYYCANIYTWLKEQIIWDNNKQDLSIAQSEELKERLANRSKFFIELDNKDPLFYQEGTFQNKWRSLYNDYCDRALSCVTSDPHRDEEAKLGSFLCRKDVYSDTYIAREYAVRTILDHFRRVEEQ